MAKKNQAPTESNQKKPESPLSGYARFTGLAFQMLTVVGLATWGGWSLDQYLNLTFPIFTIVLVLVAIIGLIYKLIRMLDQGNE